MRVYVWYILISGVGLVKASTSMYGRMGEIPQNGQYNLDWQSGPGLYVCVCFSTLAIEVSSDLLM